MKFQDEPNLTGIARDLRRVYQKQMYSNFPLIMNVKQNSINKHENSALCGGEGGWGGFSKPHVDSNLSPPARTLLFIYTDYRDSRLFGTKNKDLGHYSV